MKALNLHGVEDLRYEEVPCPERKSGEVLLKIKAAGICGSDIPRVFAKGTYHFLPLSDMSLPGRLWRRMILSLWGEGPLSFLCFPVASAQPARRSSMPAVQTMTTTAPAGMGLWQNI